MSEREDARAILRELLHEALAVPNGHPAPEPAGAAPPRSRRPRWRPCCARRPGAGRPPTAR